MTARRDRRLPLARLLLAAGLLALGGGCRLFRGDDGPSGGGRGGSSDPLLGKYIPKTDLPLPGREDRPTGRARDPLLTTPARGEKGEKSAAAGEPFRRGQDTTAAALAGGPAPDDSVLSIGDRPDRRGPGKAAGRGPVPLTGGGYESAAAELRRLGAKFGEPVREGSEYVLRADVPVGGDGAYRRYEGVGDSPAAATRQVLEQVQER